MGTSRYCLVLNQRKMTSYRNQTQSKVDFYYIHEYSFNIVSRAGLANHLRNMQHLEFVLLIQKVYRGLLNGVEGLHAQGNMIVEVLESLR